MAFSRMNLVLNDSILLKSYHVGTRGLIWDTYLGTLEYFRQPLRRDFCGRCLSHRDGLVPVSNAKVSIVS
jgi:hypothetical protein